METIQIVAIAASVIALLFAGFLTSVVLKKDSGSDRIRFIGDAIQKGAMAFLSREYRLLAIFVVVMAIILGVFVDFD
ncbi:MAG: sodium-translocating pyrophosphatase, partial [Chloroflexi bacterium]|nr:sodium-translocating pyrophosphatase [Chloroflexota bacterium]